MRRIELNGNLSYTKRRPNVCINVWNYATLNPQFVDPVDILEILWLINFRSLVEMRMRHSL